MSYGQHHIFPQSSNDKELAFEAKTLAESHLEHGAGASQVLSCSVLFCGFLFCFEDSNNKDTSILSSYLL